MSTNKAIVVTAIGQPVTLSERPILPPGPKQVQVRVTVAALNPHDHKSRDMGLFVKDSLPAVLANDVAGVVSALGSEVTKYKVGDHVFAQGGMAPDSSQKGLQEYALVEEAYSAKVPQKYTDSDAASIPTNILPAVVAFWHASGFALPAPWTEEAKAFDWANTSLLILGGGSNCGRFAVQAAKLSGFGKIVVVGGNEEQLKKFGATHVLDRHGSYETILEQIRSLVGDDLLYAFDAINAPDGQSIGIDALSSKKTGILTRLLPLGPPKLRQKQSGFEVKNVYGMSHERPEVGGPFWEKIGEWLEQGKIVPLAYDVVDGLDVGKANEVLDHYRDGKPVTQTHFHISS